ncbi:MAG TPA: IS110 family transposase [Vicinamibacterales bacterium]|nr:IS110 family transposase [Vicinamibacterales bacterium]
MATTRSEFRSVNEATLYVALELSKQTWKLGLSGGFGTHPYVCSVPSGDFAAIDRVIARARQQFGLGIATPIVSCYEAGRDGFWIHRALTARGWANRVVDSASIEVNRRQRRTKTDRVDAQKLVTMLVRACCGEPDVWREVRVPSEAAEAARHVSRERTALKEDENRVRNQIESWLATYGCQLGRRERTGEWWTRARDWQGRPLPAPVQQRIARATARLRVILADIVALEAAQAAAVAATPADSALGRLVRVRGVATTSASVLLDEGLIWRDFQNRREIGGLLGFAPAKYNSGEAERDQGISRAGNRRLQAISIQLAWNWVRWQPLSALTQWYLKKFGVYRRARRIGIVALARKLVIALWRYATTGVAPAGAVLKA